MNFPLYISLGRLKIHPHTFFDFLAYTVGIRLFFRFQRPEELNRIKTIKIGLGAVLGASIGSIVLNWFSDPRVWLERPDIRLLFQGKTVVGGLLGGLVGVELSKKTVGHSASTGDFFVVPLMMGMGIGRLGCFLSGLQDNTFGIPTTLPWGINFGDGISRHPAQLYEIIFLAFWGFVIYTRKQFSYRSGDLFRWFMGGYLSFRFLIDFLKPYPRFFAGVGVVQLGCLVGLVYYWKDLPRLLIVQGDNGAESTLPLR